MNYIRRYRKKAGYTQVALADAIGVHETAVTQWEKGIKSPTDDNMDKLAKLLSCTIYDLFPEIPLPENVEAQNYLPSPFAKYKGTLQLGEEGIDVYVLDTGERVISLTATVGALSGKQHGNIHAMLSPQLEPYFKAEALDNALIEFYIPQTGIEIIAKGLQADMFLEICRAYVTAMAHGKLTTDRQKEIGVRASMLIASCAKVGLIALIDEATGYQYDRAQDALQLKLRLFIAEEMRAWEKTFPDALWEEFGRLTHWNKPLHIRPKWWGKLVMELIYDALDPDVANYLRTNTPPPMYGQNYHQYMSDYGLKHLIPHIHQVVGIAKTCETLQELRDRVSLYYGKKPVQLTLYLPSVK